MIDLIVSLSLVVLQRQDPPLATGPVPQSGQVKIGDELDAYSTNDQGGSTSQVLEIYDVRDLIAPDPHERVDPEQSTAMEAAVSLRIEANVRDLLDASNDATTSLRSLENGVLIVAASSATQAKVRALLELARACRAQVNRSPTIACYSLDLDAEECALLRLGTEDIELIDDLQRQRLLAHELMFGKIEDRKLRLKGQSMCAGTVMPFHEKHVDGVRATMRYIEGYETVEKVAPDYKTLRIPRLGQVRAGMDFLVQAIPIAAETFTLRFSVTQLEHATFERNENELGPIAIPSQQESHVESEITLAAGQWAIFTTSRTGAARKGFALWIYPMKDGVTQWSYDS